MADLTLVTGGNGNGSGQPPLVPEPRSQKSIKRGYKLSARDLSVASLAELNFDEDEIALRLGMNTLSVKDSLLKWYRKQLNSSAKLVNMKINEVALARLEGVNALLEAGLKKMTVLRGTKGEVIGEEIDFGTRRQMAHLLKDLIQIAQPKAAAQINLNNQNNQQNNYIGGQKGLNMEGRLRAIRERNGLKNDDAEESSVIDAEFEDEGDEDDEDETTNAEGDESTIGDEE